MSPSPSRKTIQRRSDSALKREPLGLVAESNPILELDEKSDQLSSNQIVNNTPLSPLREQLTTISKLTEENFFDETMSATSMNFVMTNGQGSNATSPRLGLKGL